MLPGHSTDSHCTVDFYTGESQDNNTGVIFSLSFVSKFSCLSLGLIKIRSVLCGTLETVQEYLREKDF